MTLLLVALVLLCVHADVYGFYDISTTNEMYYLAHPKTCYTFRPVERPEQKYYVKVTANGNKLDTAVYQHSDCSTEINAYTFDYPFKKFESYPNQVGGIAECTEGDDPDALAVYFRHSDSCVYVAEDTWLTVSKVDNGMAVSVSNDGCKTYSSNNTLTCGECSSVFSDGKKYKAMCEDSTVSIGVLLLSVIIVLLICYSVPLLV